MRIIPRAISNIYFFFALHEKRLRNVLISSLKKLKDNLKEEGQETKKMMEVYYRYTHGKASKSEMDEANEQFRDLLRALGLGIFVVLPFAPVTIPFVVKIGKKLGINILPSSFRDKD